MPTQRTSTYPINPLILHRWSPRALSGEAIDETDLMTLFEAARWAPSAYNNQPWRFIYAKRDTEHWDALFGLMVEFNQRWTKQAGALVVVVSNGAFEYNGKPNPTHAFDTGSAWENLALQASSMGLIAHAMSGFDYEAAREVLGIPEGFHVHAMIAIGKPGTTEDLSEDMQEQEVPSDRRPLNEIIMEGRFTA